MVPKPNADFAYEFCWNAACIRRCIGKEVQLPMRAVVGCAILSLIVLAARSAEGGPPPPRFGEQSCEEQCREDRARDDATCDDTPFRASDRALCHESVRARLDVCLRICED
jgi:hypothetical protein